MRKLVLGLLLLAGCATASSGPRANVRIDTGEAEAVLAILDARAAGREPGEAEWQRLFGSEGYVRLKKREHAMGRLFEDDAFREFVTSPALLAKRAMLREALDRVRRADLSAAAGRALAYLPSTATIDATIYPVIKPRENSFVFENDALFKYLEDEPRERFEETIAHELHHIGYGTVCAAGTATGVQKWVGAFGEGLAALAAAGGLDGDPYASAAPDVRAAWQRGMANYASELARVEQFFHDVADGKLTGDEIDERAFELFGVLGPWYTVGWKMSATIEEELGREELVRAFCGGGGALLSAYNRAADARERRIGERLPRWSERLIPATKRCSTC